MVALSPPGSTSDPVPLTLMRGDFRLPKVLAEANEPIPTPTYAKPTPLSLPLLLKGVTPLVMYDTLRRVGLPKDAAMRTRGYGSLFAQCLGNLAYGAHVVDNCPIGTFTPQFKNLLNEVTSFVPDRDKVLYDFTLQACGFVFDVVSIMPMAYFCLH
jgi:hypothetical protein